MPILKIYNKEKELILVSQEFTGDKGWGLLTDLLPNTTYEEGTYFVSWEDKDFESEKIPVPRFTTESNTNKELVFYFKDALTVEPMTAYDIAVKNGFSGTEQEWVKSIKGEPGRDGIDLQESGSAYDLWISLGNRGTKEEFLESLKGIPGNEGDKGDKGDKGDTLKYTELSQAEKEELKRNITDQAVTDFVLEGESISEDKLMDNTIGVEKVNFVKSSKNLLNKNDVIAGKNLDTDTGELIKSTSGVVFNKWFELTPGETYISSDLYAQVFYDENKQFISGVRGNGAFVVPENAKYTRFSTMSVDTAQLNVGNTLKPYDEYFEPYLDEDIGIKNLSNNSIGTLQIKNNSVTVDKVDFISKSNNLIDKNKISKGYGFTSDGSITEDARHAISDYVPIIPNQTYTVSGNSSRVIFYDEKKEYIDKFFSSDFTATFTAPSNAHYLRTNITKTRFEDAMLNEGSELLPYEDWHEPVLEGVTGGSNIDSEKLTEEIIKKIKEEENTQEETPIKDRKTFTLDTSLDLNYTPETIQGCSDDDPLPMSEIKYTDMYDMYDELCNKYPNYVSRKVEGKNILEDEIISYTFKPEQQLFTLNSKEVENTFKRFKFFIVTSTHGNERTSTWVLYNLMKLICEKWQTNESLEFLRWNVEFVICPIINPGGYRKFTRVNANGVDLNRNFDADWEYGSSDKSDTTYRGDAPMSEPEAIVCDNILKRESPSFVIDFHNFHAQSTPTSFNWALGFSDKINDIADLAFSKMARKWKKQYPDLPQDVVGFGQVSQGIHLGLLTNYAQKKYGIPSSAFEVCWKMDAKTDSIKRDSFISTIGVDSFSNFLLQIANNANEL